MAFPEANSTSNAPHSRKSSIGPFQRYRWMDIDSLPALNLRQRLHYLPTYAKWQSLIEIAVEACAPNAKCLLNPKIGFSGEHMICEVCSDDHVSWTAKLPTGPIYFTDESGMSSFLGGINVSEMQIEIDTMKLLANQSSIPVPRVHATNSCQNSIHLPWCYLQGRRKNIYCVRYSNYRRTIPDGRGLLQGVVNVERTRPSTNNETEPGCSRRIAAVPQGISA